MRQGALTRLARCRAGLRTGCPSLFDKTRSRQPFLEIVNYQYLAALLMATKRTAKHTAGQLGLGLAGHVEAMDIEGGRLFSVIYLRKFLPTTEDYPTVAEVQPLYESVKARWLKHWYGMAKAKEAHTRTQFLDPLLKELGWYFLPEQDLPPGQSGMKKRPDYCLCRDEPAMTAAAEAGSPTEAFRYATTVLEAKKVHTALDEISKSETPGWFPSQQIQDYLHHAKDASGSRFFDWAILTNGHEWRLYSDRAAADAFFSIEIARDEEFCSLEDFRLFVALFRPSAFERRPDNRCQLDDIREESLKRQSSLELNLRKRIFGILEDLANGYRDHAPNGITESEWPMLYDTCLIYLYRLLFILYAESRYLLPVRPSGHRSNKAYRERYSLASRVERLRDRANHFTSAHDTDLYDQLLRLFRLIDGVNPKLNQECDVARYNGGLFNPDQHPKIEQWGVPDQALADVLRQLIFAQPPARKSVKQLEISTEDAIDYSSLEVRQLGDIYEGLLGARLGEKDGRLIMQGADGSNHREGIYYTPDWIVRYLLDRTLGPLLAEIEASAAVKSALAARSEEKRRNNSFAEAVLALNLVDPAMGSGHFLVRATEWLAKRIHEHPTTRRLTERYGVKDDRSKDAILKDGLVPVHKDFPQEHAEIGAWRRRIVEACIYGVDLNPLAVELTKLSLWLTCIAVDEPLNFLDHHLRPGNSLLFARTAELNQPPLGRLDPEQQKTFSLRDAVSATLRDVIAQNTRIEGVPSTEMALVKSKEDGWKRARQSLAPLLHVGDLWLAALDGALTNPEDYRLLALHSLGGAGLSADERKAAASLASKTAAALAVKRADLVPLHWELEFPEVFFAEDGSPLPDISRGFDAVLGNPPYISVHTSTGATYRTALEKRAGYAEDLYLHFAEHGFDLLRVGGRFGFIVSDTFFTLDTKLRMRELLQTHTLEVLGQCDPFDATVDAAIYVAAKSPPTSDHEVFFVQARPRRDLATGKPTDPEPWLEKVPAPSPALPAHGEIGPIRYHRVPAALFSQAHHRVFFEPRPATLTLFKKFNSQVAKLTDEWWERIKDSRRVVENSAEIRQYQAALKPGDVTLVGLIAEGGQGMRTANNARFLGYLEGTPPAREILRRRTVWTDGWLAHPKIGPEFRNALLSAGGDLAKPTADSAAWEATVEPLRRQFDDVALGFGKTDLYRIVPTALVATPDDFQFAWTQRKAELLARWQKASGFKEFWSGTLADEEFSAATLARLRKAKSEEVNDSQFCRLCVALKRWIEASPIKGRAERREALGLRSSEFYTEAEDCARIATIYNGLGGKGQFVPFRKGDPDGNRWIDDTPLFIEWSRASVSWLSTSEKARWQGHGMFFTPGLTYNLHGRGVPLKSKLQKDCVFDASASRLSPITKAVPADYVLCLFNSAVVTEYIKRFANNTWYEINDLRQVPIVVPTTTQRNRFSDLAEHAMEAKRCEFANQAPSQALAAFCRATKDALVVGAPAYLRPPAQEQLLATPSACLAVIELAVDWEAEKLYGVEGLGPFDEF